MTPLSGMLRLILLAAPLAAQQVFLGNLHSHTSYSDGTGTPAQAFRHARDIARLDFLAITEHNHASAGRIAKEPNLYNGSASTSLKSAAARATRAGRFVALYGQEFSTIGSGNHANVIDAPVVITASDVPNGAWDRLLEQWLPAHRDSTGSPPVLLLNHPATASSPAAREYGLDDFPSVDAWLAALDARVSLINIINGPSHSPGAGHRSSTPSEREFLRYLNLGLHVAPTADQDNHKTNWGDCTDARTGIIATGLTKKALLAAMRARNVYATTDKNLRVIAKMNGSLMGMRHEGTQVPAAGTALDITVAIQDDNEANAFYDIHVFADHIGGDAEADVVASVHVEGNGTFKVPGVVYEGGRQYFFLKIVQSDDDAVEQDTVWTAPVWFEPAGSAVAAPVVSLSLGVDVLREEAVVTNRGTEEVDLSGWTLVSTVGDQRFTFPDAVRLRPGAAVTVMSGARARKRPQDALLWTTNYIWHNDGDPGELRDSGNVVVATSQ